MSRINKVLLTIFVILIVLIAGEVLYYIFSFAKTKPPTKTAIVAETIQTSPKMNATRPSLPSLASRNQTKDFAISDDNLKSLMLIEKGTLVSSLLKNKYKGKITMLSNKGGAIEGNIFKTLLVISDGKNFASFYLGDTDLQKVRVVELKDSSESVLNLGDLKVGDSITIEQTIDLQKTFKDNFVEFKISKG
ncbi:hypothetical protein HY041_00790 [Candidatus Roizmanbacteria bacterium]|nr:hypothetical protein [Candidatus Roizmanbacteria bacterium]